MKNEITKILILFILFLLNFIDQSNVIISTLSAVIFLFFVYLLFVYRTEIFLGYLFVNIGLSFLVVSGYLIDLFPKVYLYEIDKYTQTTNITSLLAFFNYSAMSLLNTYRFKLPKFKKIYYIDSELVFYSYFINIAAILVFISFFYMFSIYGFPFMMGFERIHFYNYLPPEWLTLYILLSIISLYSGFMYYKTNKVIYIFFIVMVIIIRLLSMQKFTELVIDMSLFFTFYIFKTTKKTKHIKKIVTFFLILTIPIALISYEGDFDILKGRLMAQSQLAYYVNKSYGDFTPRIIEMVDSELNNFSGDEDTRISLFEQGHFYGLFKLMELSNTGRDLLSQAKEHTSSSGSIPIIYIYYFGYILGYIFFMLSVLILKYIYDFILLYIVKTNNIIVLMFSTLILLRIYKFFVVGSPSYLYNKQFLVYGILIFIFMFLKFIYLPRKKVIQI